MKTVRQSHRLHPQSVYFSAQQFKTQRYCFQLYITFFKNDLIVSRDFRYFSASLCFTPSTYYLFFKRRHTIGWWKKSYCTLFLQSDWFTRALLFTTCRYRTLTTSIHYTVLFPGIFTSHCTSWILLLCVESPLCVTLPDPDVAFNSTVSW